MRCANRNWDSMGLPNGAINRYINQQYGDMAWEFLMGIQLRDGHLYPGASKTIPSSTHG